jgi:hypothetical protein
MSSQLINPLQFFADLSGLPLNAGYLYIGQPNTNPTTNPVVVYQDLAMTIPMQQPLRTIQGVISLNGQPLPVYVGSDSYSVLVTDNKGNTVWSQLSVTDPVGAAAQLVENLTTTLDSSTGSSLVGFIQTGAGAIERTLQSKGRDSVNVNDFGGQAGGDVSAAFQDAVNALPAIGGQIDVPSAAYVINTAPNVGAKSVYWNFGAGAVITGTQTTFPAMFTNNGVLAVGSLIQSQSTVQATPSNGTAAFCVEALQPVSLNGGVSAIYAGVNLLNPGANSIGLAANFVATAQAGSSGNVWGLEIDVGMYAPTSTGNQFGISLNGLGTGNPTFGIKMQRADSSLWLIGLDIRNAITGILIENTAGLTNGIIVGQIPTQYPGQTMMVGQLQNSQAALLLQRFTDTSPVGYLINGVNNANTAQLFSVDVNGSLYAAKNVITPVVQMLGPAAAVPAGNLQLGALTATTATAGSAALPANALGFLIAYLGATEIKIPYYNV